MQNFDDYVAEQAKQQANAKALAEQRAIQAEADRVEAGRKADEIFSNEVMPVLRSAAKALSAQVESRAESARVMMQNTGFLHIGGAHAPKKLKLTVTQYSELYKFEVDGPYNARGETKVPAAEMPVKLHTMVKDVIDRWFGTNAYKR